MIKEFITGKTYRYTEKERPKDDNWNPEGEMDFVLDMKPKKCKEGNKKRAIFMEEKNNKDYLWNWENGFENWIEVSETIIAEPGTY